MPEPIGPASDREAAAADDVGGPGSAKTPAAENVVPFAPAPDAAAARAPVPPEGTPAEAGGAPARAGDAGGAAASRAAAPPPASSIAADLIKSEARVDRASLQGLLNDVLTKVDGSRAYYEKKGGGVGKTARRLRLAAVVFGVLGGLCPLLPANLIGGLAISPLGFVLFALAAAAVLLDQAFGYSSTWMRMRLAEAELGKLITSFDAEVRGALSCAPDPLSGDEARAVLARMAQFAITADAIVVRETQTWVAENKAQLLQVETITKSSGRPGVVDQGTPRVA